MAERNYIPVTALKARVAEVGLTLEELLDRMSGNGDAPGIAAVERAVQERELRGAKHGQ